LARKEIQINQADDEETTPLYIACQNGHVKVVKALLINKEIDINKDCKGETPLACAIGEGHTKIAALLQQHGAK
jgi:ankyrin repeat protein